MVVEQLDQLYRDVILDHFKEPRNVGELPDADITADGTNPLCGDEAAFYLKLNGDRVAQVRFKAKGCAISQAAGSMFTEQMQGKSLADVRQLIQTMKGLMQGQDPDAGVDLGDLESLAGVRKFPVRVKCAALSWNIVEQGLKEHEQKHMERS